jgi:hypothetical protein
MAACYKALLAKGAIIMDKKQRMPLADDLFPFLVSGDKVCTIRAGKRDIEPGEMTFYTKWREADVMVTEVRHKKLSELTDHEAQLDGANNAAHMAECLKRFYPDIGPDSIITVVLYDKPHRVGRTPQKPSPRGPR